MASNDASGLAQEDKVVFEEFIRYLPTGWTAGVPPHRYFTSSYVSRFSVELLYNGLPAGDLVYESESMMVDITVSPMTGERAVFLTADPDCFRAFRRMLLKIGERRYGKRTFETEEV